MANQHPSQTAAQDSDNKSEPAISIKWPAVEQIDGSSLTDLVRVGLASLCQDASSLKTWGQLLVEKLITKALGGDMRVTQEIWTRLEGKPGTADPAACPPVAIDEELARLILEYGSEKTDGNRAEVGGGED